MPDLPPSVIDDPEYQSVHKRREKAATDARAAQQKFFRFTGAFVVATAVAAICSGLILYGIDVPPDSADPVLGSMASELSRQWLLFLTAVSLAIAAFCSHLLGVSKFGNRHRENRLEAEILRFERERVALKVAHRIDPEAFKSAGESFRAFVERQEKYLSDAAQKNRKSAYSATVVAAVLAALAAAAGALGSLENKVILAAIAFLGVCTPALGAAVESWSQATGDTQRADLHEQSWKDLVAVRSEEADLNNAIEHQDLDAALAYAEKVFAVLAADVQEFVRLRESANDT
ncbi:MAG: DUF4231 domain-containing protein [Pseudomonadota bacterium]